MYRPGYEYNRKARTLGSGGPKQQIPTSISSDHNEAPLSVLYSGSQHDAWYCIDNHFSSSFAEILESAPPN